MESPCLGANERDHPVLLAGFKERASPISGADYRGHAERVTVAIGGPPHFGGRATCSYESGARKSLK